MGRMLKTVNMLNAAMDHINSVPHKVGLRWVFYRLLQDGILTSKDDYLKLKSAASGARKDFWNGWVPDTLEDAGRAITSSSTPIGKVRMLELLPYYIELVPHLYAGQDCVPFLVYESATSNGQFDHFVPWCDRTSLRGDASIPHKWNIAKRCEELSNQYGLPAHILYFGDLDYKGLQIPKSAMRDVIEWAECDVTYTRHGITEAQAQRYGIPERPDKPGVYEWESLESEDAGEVIINALGTVVDLGQIKQGITKAEDLTIEFRSDVETVLSNIQINE